MNVKTSSISFKKVLALLRYKLFLHRLFRYKSLLSIALIQIIINQCKILLENMKCYAENRATISIYKNNHFCRVIDNKDSFMNYYKFVLSFKRIHSSFYEIYQVQ